jgi:hypothetical protein
MGINPVVSPFPGRVFISLYNIGLDTEWFGCSDKRWLIPIGIVVYIVLHSTWCPFQLSGCILHGSSSRSSLLSIS